MTADQMDAVLHGLVAADEIGPIDALDLALTSRNGTFKDAQGGDHAVVLEDRQRALRPARPGHQAGVSRRPRPWLRGRPAGRRLQGRPRGGAGPDQRLGRRPDGAADQAAPAVHEDITEFTRLVLVNAIYLKAAWLTAFDADATSPATFTLAGGKEIQVPTMSTTRSLRYAAGSGWQAVELPYIGNQLAMTIVVPDDLAAFTASLSADRFGAVVSALASRQVSLTLPKFSFASRQDLAPVLTELGMPLAFSCRRRTSPGITQDESIVITKVIHQANDRRRREGHGGGRRDRGGAGRRQRPGRRRGDPPGRSAVPVRHPRPSDGRGRLPGPGAGPVGHVGRRRLRCRRGPRVRRVCERSVPGWRGPAARLAGVPTAPC